MNKEDIKSGIMKENFPMDKLIEQLENNVLKSRNDTENIQGLINERNKQNKRIEELVLEIERLNNIINELEKYIIDKERECNGKIINYSISVEERIKYGNYNDIYDNVLDKLKELKGE